MVDSDWLMLCLEEMGSLEVTEDSFLAGSLPNISPSLLLDYTHYFLNIDRTG